MVELSLLQFDRRAQWHIHQADEKPTGDWADYLRGETRARGKHYPLNVGQCGVVEGSLTIGGLLSSAAVIIAFMFALCKLNDIHLTPTEMIDIAQEAENQYAGELDQSCRELPKKEHLLYLDTLDGFYELIPKYSDMKSYKIAIFFSGVERALAGSAFNMHGVRKVQRRRSPFCSGRNLPSVQEPSA